MSATYKKAGGSAGSKGVDFQIDLLSVFLLNALKSIKGWRLSTENKLAGKFDDVVLELSDGSAILLQAKHKEKKKVTLEQLLSTNSKNEDFSLPKYFFSYLNDVKTKFPVKSIIICTNTQADKDTFRFLNRNNVCKDSILHYEDGASFFTFSDDILPDLMANSKVYHKNVLLEKGVNESVITEENLKEFLKHLQMYIDYPAGNGLEKVLEKILSGLKCSDNLFHNTSYQDLHQKIKDWFEQPKGEYLTECRATSMFCEIRSQKYRLLLEDHNVYFRNNDINVMNSKERILHVVAEGEYLLHLLKVHRSLQHNEIKILYAGPDDGLSVQEQVIGAFELPLYTYLIIVSPKFSDEIAISEICLKLGYILHKQKYKKVVFVAESNNKLVQRIKSTESYCDSFYNYSPTLEDLSEDTQQVLLRRKNILFQGDDVSIEQLFPKYVIDDVKKSIQSKTLERLVTGEKIKVGMRLNDLENDFTGYYTNRKFQRTDIMGWGVMEGISEEVIYNVDEKVILISDGAGGGKTTVLKNLAITVKKSNPHLWVIRIELNDYSKILRDSLKKGKSIDVQELLSCRDTTRLTNDVEKFLFSLNGRVVLMLDGVDEISPDYKSLIMDLLLQSKKAENLQKVFVTARSHMEQELATQLKVTSFTLVPLTKQNQIDFFVYYWTHALELEGESRSKCERYATILINRVYSWTINWYDNVRFVSSPLQARMLAEIFLENKGHEEWEGCKEYLNGVEMEPKLPVKMNIVKLYDMFIDKKRDIFMDKGNPSGNATANQALMDQFEECLTYHRSLALETILDEEKCALFSCYQQNVRNGQMKVLIMGLVQKLDDKLSFVHRTFAEYFVAECLLKELQLRNNDDNFQKFIIDEVFFNSKFDILRNFLNNHLQKNISSVSFDIFKIYMSLVDGTQNSSIIHRLAAEGNTEIIRFVLKCIDFKVILDRETTVYYGKSRLTKMNTLNILKYLVEHGGINIRDNKDRTPLHRAVYCGHLNTLKFLVEVGANVNSNTDNGTALHCAARRGNVDMVEFLVKYVVDINRTNSKGYTALHYAIDRCSFDIVKCLVEHGADINIANKEGCTTLHFAVSRGRFDIVEFLIKHNVDINIMDEKGRTALHFAAGNASLDIVELLLKQKADINIVDKEGNTSLHLAAWGGCFSIIEILVKNNTDMNMTNEKGQTPLHFAAAKDNFDIVKFLVKNNANINIADKDGCTALHCAVEQDNFDIVELLVKYGANVNTRNKEGYTALHFAAENSSFDIVELILKHGADIHIGNNEGYTALYFAIKRNNFDIVELLMKHDGVHYVADKGGYTALHYAVQEAGFNIVKLLVEHIENINDTTKEGYTALHLAVKNGSFDTVELLVKYDAETNIANNEGSTALHFAAKNGSFDIVELLVKHNVDIHIADKQDCTALHYAVQGRSLNIVELLVKSGANINAVTKDGYTTLHLAVQKYSFNTEELILIPLADSYIAKGESHPLANFPAKKASFKIVQLLLKHGVDIHIADMEGYTALHYAVEGYSLSIVKLLVEQTADINVMTKKGYSALHFAVKKCSFLPAELLMMPNADSFVANNENHALSNFAAKRASFNIVKFLIQHGVNIDIVDQEGYTALHYAVQGYSLSIVELLVKLGAKVNTRSNEGYTALHFAVEKGNLGIVEFLMRHGADTSITNSEGYTALHFAAKNNSFNMVQFLVKHGVDIHIADKDGYTALHHAIKSNSFIVEHLMNQVRMNLYAIAKKGFTMMQSAVQSASFDIVQLLVEHGANINIRTNSGYTALQFAAGRGTFDIAEFLVKRNVDINIANNEGFTALHLAAKNSKHSIVELLVKHGADINIANNEGHTALHLAAKKGSFHVIKILVEHGVDINVTSKQGFTALHFAVKTNFLDVVELLVKHDINTNIANKEGYTALQFAVETGNSDIVEFLKKHCMNK